jgi:hypothetical protein
MLRPFAQIKHPPFSYDQTVRACPECGGELLWRYRKDVTWDRGLPVCETHGLLSGWIVISRDGRRLLGIARVDNKGRVLADPVPLPIRPRSERNARHHFKKRPTPQRSLLSIDNRATSLILPQAWPLERYGPAVQLGEVER